MAKVNESINRCGKCGASQEKITIKYHLKLKEVVKNGRKRPNDDDSKTNGTECIAGEHLHCICTRCSYAWVSDPITKSED